MTVTQTVTYDTSTSFTFSSAFIGITNSTVTLLSRIGANETFFIPFSTTADPLREPGTITVSKFLNATVTGGVLDLTNNDVSYALYNASLTTIATSKGTIRYKLTPNYSGAPAATNSHFQYGVTTSGVNNNIISVQHISTGIVKFYAGDSVGTLVINHSVASWSPASGTTYEWEIDYDFSAGATQIYIDGVSFGAQITTTLAQDPIKKLAIGALLQGATPSNFSIADYQHYSEKVHTDTFSSEIPRTVPNTDFSTDNDNVLVNSAVGMSSINAFTHTAAALSGSDQIYYTFYDGTDDFYVTGGSWATSSGTIAQANLASSLASAAATTGGLDVNPDASLRLRAYLHSGDGTTGPTLTSAAITYNLFVSQATPNICIVYGYVLDGQANKEGANIRIWSDQNDPFFTSGNMFEVDEETTTSSDGYWAIEVPETTTAGTTLNVQIDFINSKGRRVKKKFKITVPNQSSAQVDNIIA